MNKFTCQTPRETCGGALETTNNVFNRTKNVKLHNSPEEAFHCFERHLLSTGHVRVGQREFRQPQGGILVLTKKCRYGGVMRKGKEGNRWMPKSARKSTSNGLITG